MTLLRIEHPVRDFAAWKRTFDSYAERRQSGGVHHYQVLRLADDPNFVLIDLAFGSREAAERWLERPAIGLDRKRPIDLLITNAGAEMVEKFLGRLEYGVYT